MKIIRTNFFFALFLLCFAPFNARAQMEMEQPSPALVTNAPATGTFYLLGHIPSPPFPFDPYHGALPVYLYDGVYFVDDSAVSFQEMSFSGEGGGMMMMSGGLAPPGASGTNGGSTNLFCNGVTNFTLSYRYATGAPSLTMSLAPSNTIAFFVNTPDTNAHYDLFGTTNLTKIVPGWNQTNWVWLLRLTPGATNFSWGQTNWCEAWFQLGTMVDDDLDTLTTAYENLVSHTLWTADDGWDSDGDGLSDGDELRHTLTDPNNPDTGNTGVPDGYRDLDGDGWTHIDGNGTSVESSAVSMLQKRLALEPRVVRGQIISGSSCSAGCRKK